ncbi:hypothetical protein [Cryptosporangium phraense]|uniref:Uncharacterized protein n=1 Tax=Cryptosporangium phraense TaxID=2593070 RepID=A0A545AXV9_9ACTN|nr:hypothetical protein [Cryptosporangium phraense]TQS46111.1 hypothetical protein FL583_06415 [Cryptosporangium phraense]
MLQRVSVMIGLFALAPLTRIWDRPWPVRLVFALAVVTLLAATTYDLLPRWFRRRSVLLVGVLGVSIVAALVPAALSEPEAAVGQLPEAAGRATFTTPRPGQSFALVERKGGEYTDGFVATGTCTVPPEYSAVIGYRATDGSGYWLLSDGILGDCASDGVTRRWTAGRVDPSWGAPGVRRAAALVVIVMRRDLALRAQVDKQKGEPLRLPRPAASVTVFTTRVALR